MMSCAWPYRDAVGILEKRTWPGYGAVELGPSAPMTFNHILGQQKPLDKVFSVGPFPVGGDGNTIAASFTSFCNLNYCPVVGPPYRFHCRSE